MATANYVSSIAALRALGATSPTVAAVRVGSYYGDGKLGGNFFAWNSTSTQADNNGTVIQATGVTTGRWVAESLGVPTVAMFGAKADAVFIYASANLSGTTLSGGYFYTTADIGKIGTIRGAGPGGAYLQFAITGASGGNATVTYTGTATAVTGASCVLGTDNWAAIQNCIDWVVYGSVGPNSNPQGDNTKVFIDGGSYVVSDVISMGYGVGYTGCILEGAGPNSSTTGCGSTIYPVFSDRPVFAIQGTRGSRLRSIGCQGLNYYYVANNTFLGLGALTIDDCVLANWVDPALSANANSRYAPYTCVAIDPYSGTAPGTPYPAVTYPSWFNGGSTPQYGKFHSSDVLMEDLFITGFVNGVSVVPSDSDGNGDFVRLTQSDILYSARALSVGNTQARETIFDYCSAVLTHTAIATAANGQQNGKIAGTILNSTFTAIQVFDVPNQGIAGPIGLEGCYGEVCWRLGIVAPAGASAAPFNMHNSLFGFEAQTDARGYPAVTLDSNGLVLPVNIEGCSLSNYLNFMSFNVDPQGFRLVGSYMEPSTASPLSNAYEQLCNNALCGGVAILPASAGAHTPPLDIAVKPAALYNLDDTYTATIYGAVAGSTTISERHRCLTPYAKTVKPRGLPSYQIPAPVNMVSPLAKTGGEISSLSLSGATLTITFGARAEWEFQLYGPLPGDLVYDDNSKTWFYVRSRSGNTVLADIRNNYRVVAGAKTQPAVYGFNAFSTTTGVLYILNTRIYTPFYYTQGDLAASSNSVTNVGRADAFYSGGSVAVNDYLFLDGTLDRSFAPGTQVSAITVASPATFTMSTTAGGASNAAYAQVRKPLNYFVRQPPANV
ncbi:MAG TPA: hypothetical protein VHZ78_05210 [Rhizomicrobium sp.]|jgi:hypothetical protein|nr:hypothetical protein [Rhizomicrobium sp.]